VSTHERPRSGAVTTVGSLSIVYGALWLLAGTILLLDGNIAHMGDGAAGLASFLLSTIYVGEVGMPMLTKVTAPLWGVGFLVYGAFPLLGGIAVLKRTDAPQTACVVMGRPTKSLSVYLQALGRGTRPWPGVVDAVPYDAPGAAALRRAAIDASPKPLCTVVDF
jgi:hypothetical protein